MCHLCRKHLNQYLNVYIITPSKTLWTKTSNRKIEAGIMLSCSNCIVILKHHRCSNSNSVNLKCSILYAGLKRDAIRVYLEGGTEHARNLILVSIGKHQHFNTSTLDARCNKRSAVFNKVLTSSFHIKWRGSHDSGSSYIIQPLCYA